MTKKPLTFRQSLTRSLVTCSMLALVLLTLGMIQKATAVKESVDRPAPIGSANYLVEKYGCSMDPFFDATHAVVKIDGQVRYVGQAVVADIVFRDFPRGDVFGFCP